MNRRWKMVLAAVAAVVAVLALAVPGLADEPTETPTPQCRPWGRGLWGHGFWGGGGWNTFDAVAEALKLSPEELFAELRSGKSIAEIAEGKGVTMETISDVVAAIRKANLTARIDELVEEGTISREQADWKIEGLEKGWFGGRGRFGRFGPRGMHGRFAVPKSAPAATAESS